MAGRFVLLRGDREQFLDGDALRRMASRGLVARGDLVYHPVLARWLYAREVEEIADDLAAAAQLGRPAPALPEAGNAEAVAGFLLGMLGYLPLVGLVCCALGIYFSTRALERARNHGLALAGLVMSLVFLVPAAVCGAVFLAALGPLF